MGLLDWCFSNRSSYWTGNLLFLPFPSSSVPSMHCIMFWLVLTFVFGVARSMHIVIRRFSKSWWSTMSFQSDMYDPEMTDIFVTMFDFQFETIPINSSWCFISFKSLYFSCTSLECLWCNPAPPAPSVLHLKWWRLLRKLQLSSTSRRSYNKVKTRPY